MYLITHISFVPRHYNTEREKEEGLKEILSGNSTQISGAASPDQNDGFNTNF